MQSKISLQWLLLITCTGGITFFLITFLFLTFYLPGHTYSYYKISTSNTFGLPVRLKIPNINVDAVIEYVGLASDGTMDVPKGPANVAWFNLGPRPGNIGSAVIAGHYGSWKSGAESVFDNLNKLRKGDKIYVEDEKGVIITFVVRESRIYDPKVNASNVFSSSDGKAHLNLVTCEGVWDNVHKTYSNRLVVFTDKE